MVAESFGPVITAAAASDAAGAFGLESPVVANFTAGAATFAFDGTAAAAAVRCVDVTFALPFPIPAARPDDRVARALSVPSVATGELQAATVVA
ncbi:hypothetical protein [Mesorhizobium sp.]|uniref:hypothetical protein n=1 Tax=Mesorhizobium sp. TaxID=1871066 RepID=UPI0025C64AC7|nr:hypothetical protein [Mesorhizobium sp.]